MIIINCRVTNTYKDTKKEIDKGPKMRLKK